MLMLWYAERSPGMVTVLASGRDATTAVSTVIAALLWPNKAGAAIADTATHSAGLNNRVMRGLRNDAGSSRRRDRATERRSLRVVGRARTALAEPAVWRWSRPRDRR